MKIWIEKFELDVNAKSGLTGSNALHHLIRFQVCPDSVEVAKLLIEKRINVDVEDKNGNNVLHYLLYYHQGCVLELKWQDFFLIMTSISVQEIMLGGTI